MSDTVAVAADAKRCNALLTNTDNVWQQEETWIGSNNKADHLYHIWSSLFFSSSPSIDLNQSNIDYSFVKALRFTIGRCIFWRKSNRSCPWGEDKMDVNMKGTRQIIQWEQNQSVWMFVYVSNSIWWCHDGTLGSPLPLLAFSFSLYTHQSSWRIREEEPKKGKERKQREVRAHRIMGERQDIPFYYTSWSPRCPWW